MSAHLSPVRWSPRTPGRRWGLSLRLPQLRFRALTRVRSQVRHVGRVTALDHYLLHQAAWRFAAVVAVVVAVMTLENGPRLAADLAHVDARWTLLWMLSVDLLPEHLAIALPVATLVSIALTARSLAQRGEWQMFAATGLSPARVMAAPLVLAALAAAMLLWNALDLRPRGERRLDALYGEIATGRHGIALPLREPIALDAHTILVADGIAPDAPGELTGVVVRRDTDTISAMRARVAADGQGGITLQLRDGTSVETRADGSARRMTFGALTLRGHPAGLALVPGNLRHRLDRLGGAGLGQAAAAGGPVGAAALAALLGRVEAALFCLLLPWIAIAIGVPPRRQPGGPALLVGIALIVLHLQTAAMIEDRWPAQAWAANGVHLAGWVAAAWGLSRWVRASGDGAVDLAILRGIAVPRRWIARGGPRTLVRRLAGGLRLPRGGGMAAPALRPAHALRG